MKFVFTIIFILFSSHAMASELKSVNDLRYFTKNIMDFVEKGESFKGINLIKPHLKIPVAEFDLLIANLKQQQPLIDQRFGKTIGIEYIGEETIGKSFLKITYVQKFENHAMIWMFYFYKPKDIWIINKFKTADDLTLLFKK